MNPRLVACMLVALMMGVAASGTALALGWSWLIALPLCISLLKEVRLRLAEQQRTESAVQPATGVQRS